MRVRLRKLSKEKLSTVTLLFMVIPFNIGEWTPIQINSHPMPVVSDENSTWKITTKNGAGGYVYILNSNHEKEPLRQASWDWKVTVFPKVEIKIPFSKQNDDFALRVGFLIEGDSSSISIPSSIEKLFERHRRISNIVFYQSVPASESNHGSCGISPYQKEILYCLRSAKSEFETITVKPIDDLIKFLNIAGKSSPKVVGIWIFSDSDNSHSESEVYLRNLKLEQGF